MCNRKRCVINGAITDVPVTQDMVGRYDLRLLFCLPLCLELDSPNPRYLVVCSADKSRYWYHDAFDVALRDMFQYLRMGYGHLLSTSFITEYYDDEVDFYV